MLLVHPLVGVIHHVHEEVILSSTCTSKLTETALVHLRVAAYDVDASAKWH